MTDPNGLGLFLPDENTRRHLTRALAEHLTWCRRNGAVPPPALAALLDWLTVTSGPDGPTLVAAAEITDAVSVNYEAAAARLGVSARTVRRLVAGGKLPAARVGRRRLIAVADLAALVEQER